ncbi:MAG TPA: hypothetical protein VFL70_09130 [Bacteroidia bacterium]|nr:hypothetical protein [Bacteroidia bacterium]
MKKQKITSILLTIVSIVIMGFGCLYIYKGFTTGLLPYHIKFLGMTCEELPPNVCELMKTFVQIIGFAFLTIGITMFLLVRAMFNNEQDVLDRRIITIIVALLAPLVPITYHLATYTPWYIIAAILVLAVIALLLVGPKNKARQ